MAGQAAVITEGALEALRARIGVEVPRPQPYIEVATKDAIKHFADGIGDVNLLWRDEEYARQTRYGTIVAPPCVLYSMDKITSGMVGGLPGIHALFAGTTFEWFEPIMLNDRVVGSSALKSIEEKKSQFANRTVLQTYHTKFTNQDGCLVATADSWCIRTERDTGREKGKYQGIEPSHYTPEQIAQYESDILAEEIRGANPRYWEDVNEGDSIGPVTKGPVTVTDFIAWLMGWGGLFVRAHRVAVEFRQRHPAAGIVNELGIPDGPERVHWDSPFAKRIGAPEAYDYGPQRVSWLGNLMTNWIGDEGFLRRLSAQVRRFNIVGDVSRCQGKVTRKYLDGDQALVDCDIWIENQRGEITAQGTATARLPRRS
ncbi:MAG: MaoC family dehydratase N-terminal domain-containing protein [Chloroflexi bacterium]|nr:MaoC family dehydratase N-terminal domain-containing protein [Chloroflexota bacterium]